MNRLIHRGWGKGFVIIFLDLSTNISQISSSTRVCALGHTSEGSPIRRCGFAIGVRRWRRGRHVLLDEGEVPRNNEGVVGATSRALVKDVGEERVSPSVC